MRLKGEVLTCGQGFASLGLLSNVGGMPDASDGREPDLWSGPGVD